MEKIELNKRTKERGDGYQERGDGFSDLKVQSVAVQSCFTNNTAE